MQRVFSYLKQHKGLVALALLMAVFNQVFSLLDPQLFRILIDNYAHDVSSLTRAEFVQGVGLLLLGIIGVAFVSRTAKAFQDYFVNVVSEKVGTALYADSVEHVFALDFWVFEDEQSGSILQKLQKARDDAKAMITSFVNVAFLSFVGVVFVLTYAFIVHWLIGTVFLVAMPIVGGLIAYLSKKIEQAQKDIVARSADLAGSTTETLQNVGLVKSLGLEDQEVDRLNTVNEAILALELKKVVLLRRLSFIQGTLVNFVRMVLLFVMFLLLFETSISLGQFFTLMFYSFFIFNPLAEMSTVVTKYQEAKASLAKLDEILDKVPSEYETSASKQIAAVEKIVFDDVSFAYVHTEKESLQNISIDIMKGSTVALVGPSGSGKSTVIKLMLGLYEPTKGVIRFNDTPAHDVDFNSVRRRLGFVPQDTQVFAGTIRENLRFAASDVDDDACLAVLKQAQAESILARAEHGLDTYIGERGIKLSGGERQRLAIARALLRKPDVLVFDEATSSLDSLTEHEITLTIQSIREKQPTLTTILVAHRLSTVAHADQLYVLEQGKVIETGTHDALVAEQGLYAAMWRQQQGDTFAG